jgi:diguanylate cyclase (GGDEF)-like protein/PAS domain S-box-containing protein/putative nucleotidyltransferase with HDIG domain
VGGLWINFLLSLLFFFSGERRIKMSGKKKRLLLSLTGAAVALAAIVVFFVSRVEAARENLKSLSGQLDKVLTAFRLQQDVIAQSYYIKGYMLYGDPGYLRQFRSYARANQEELEQLYDIVRPERKPLVREIQKAVESYTAVCEKDIVPKVEQGDLDGAIKAARENGAVSAVEECLRLAAELEDLRVGDTRALFAQVVNQALRDVSLVLGATLLIFFSAGALGLLVTASAALENRTYRLVLTAARYATVVVRRNGRIRFFNRLAEEIFGLERKSALGRRFAEVFTGRACPGEIAFAFPVEKVLVSGTGLCNQEKAYLDKEGWRYSLLVDCLPLKENGVIAGAVLLIRDVTEEKVIEERLRGLAVRDAMTGLYNHSYLKQVLGREIERAGSRDGLVSFMILDVDSFKYYNDSFGHPAGDDVLKKVARLIQESVRGTDIVGRYGGDEFAVVLPDADQLAAAEVGERIRKNIEGAALPYCAYMPGGKLTVSAGVACYPLQAKSSAELIRMADEALYRVKRTTKNRVEIYSSVLEEIMEGGPVDRRLTPHVGTLLTALKAKDPYTYAHCENVARYAVALAQKAGLPPEEASKIKIAALLHDLGKVEIPLETLTKTEPLTPEEWALIRRHASLGAELVGQIKPLAGLVPAILHHHERYDGAGYPQGLAGEEIPLAARIIALADAYDAMTTYRPYRPPRTPDEALAEIEKEVGRQFDPVLAGCFIQIVKEEGEG